MNCTNFIPHLYTSKNIFKKVVFSKLLLFFFINCSVQSTDLFSMQAQAQAFGQQAAQAIGQAAARATLEAAAQALHGASAPQVAAQEQQVQTEQNTRWYQKLKHQIKDHPDISKACFWCIVGGVAAVALPGSTFFYIGAKFIGGGCTAEMFRKITVYFASNEEVPQLQPQIPIQPQAPQTTPAPTQQERPELTFRVLDTMTFDMRRINNNFEDFRESTQRNFMLVRKELSDVRQDVTAVQQQITNVTTRQQNLEKEQTQFRNFIERLVAEHQRRSRRLPAGDTVSGVTVEPYDDDEAIVPQVQTPLSVRNTQQQNPVSQTPAVTEDD